MIVFFFKLTMHKEKKKYSLNSLLPPRKVPFIGSVTNKSIFDQLGNFINSQNEKILILCNHESISEQSGVGKKSFLIEYCHVVKEKYNIKWISARTDSKFYNELNKIDFNSKASQHFEIPMLKLKNLVIFYDVIDSDLIEKNIYRINLNNTKIIIISHSAFFKFSKFRAKYLKFLIQFSLEDLKVYFSHFPETRHLHLNELVDVISLNNLKPFLFHLLAKFLKFNHLHQFSELFTQNSKFDLNFLFEFLNNLNRIAFEICMVFSYVEHDCVPKDLILSIFKLSIVKMQVPLNILTHLGILEKFFLDKNLYFKMNEYLLNDLRSFIISNESLDDELFLRSKIAKSLCQLLPCIQKRDFTRFTRADIYFSSIEKFLGLIDFGDLCVFEDNFASILIQLIERYVQLCDNNKKNNREKLIKYALVYYRMKKKFRGDENICEVIKIGNFLASIYFENGFYNETLKIYEEIKTFNSQVYTSDSLEIAKNIFNIANCYLKMYKYSWALYFFKDSLRIRLKLLGDKIDPEITDTIYLIGVCYLKLDNIRKAFLYHMKAYQMRVKLFGNRSLKTADSMDCLGECNFKMKIYKEARIFYEKSYQFRSLIVNQNDPAMIETLINLIQVLITVKAFKEAWYLLNKNINLKDIHSTQSIKVSYLKGRYLIENGQLNEAIIHLLQGFYNYGYSKQINKEIKLSLLNSLVDSYDKIGQKSKSQEYFIQAYNLSEEIRKQKIEDRLYEIETWSDKIVQDWMTDNNINRNFIEFFKEIDGKKLVEYYLKPTSYSSEIKQKLTESKKSEITVEDCDKFIQIFQEFVNR